MKKYLLLIVLFSFIALWPFLRPGFFQSHDGEWMIVRFTAFHQALTGGQFPVRFVDRLNNNYGYPVLNFLYPLPFYMSEIPNVSGFDAIESIKFTFVISTIFSTIFMFWALAQKYSYQASFAGALIYLYIPYRFVDLYVRGSIGENLAFVFLPLIIGSLFKIANGNKKYLPLLSLAVSLLIVSHNVIAFVFLPFFTIFCILFKKQKTQTIMFILLGLLISAFFWIPALFDLQYVKLSQIKVSDATSHLVNIDKLIIPSWGFDPDPNSTTGLSTQFGLLSITSFFIFLCIFIKSKSKNKINLYFIASYLLVFFLLTKASALVWTTIPNIDVIQFPWRLLSLIVFITPFMVATFIDSMKRKVIVSAAVIFVAILLTFPYTTPKNLINLPESYYSTNEDTTTVREEYMPLTVKEKKSQRANNKIETEAIIISQQIKPTSYKAKIQASTDNTVVNVNSIYYPGWQVIVNNQVTTIDYSNPFGLISFQLPKGEHDVIIKYNKTPVHLLSEIISFAALLLTGFFFFKWRKQNF